MENFGNPTDEQWSKIKKFVKGENYHKEDFFVFETLAVGDKIVPNRYTRLMPSLLEVMEKDAKKGVSLMLNHNWGQMGVQSIPIGKVFDGEIRGGSQKGETQALYVQQYIPRSDSKVDGYSKNDIIDLIETGVIADTSVGFASTPESYKCSICGNSIYDFDRCKHIPGQKYKVEENGRNVTKQCIVEINAPSEIHEGNNVLIENSVVFDGAYPNAVIQSIAGNGNSNLNILDFSKKEKQEYNVDSNDYIVGYSHNNDLSLILNTCKEGGKEKMENLDNEEVVEEVVEETVEETVAEPVNEPAEEPVEEVAEEAVEEPIENPEQPAEEENAEVEEPAEEVNEEPKEEPAEESLNNQSVNILNSEVQDILGTEVFTKSELLSLLRDGYKYKQAKIENALETGVKAFGNAFDKESFELTFNKMSIEEIEKIESAWNKQAEELFSKERVSIDKEPKEREDLYTIKPAQNLKTVQY